MHHATEVRRWAAVLAAARSADGVALEPVARRKLVEQDLGALHLADHLVLPLSRAL